MCSKVVTIESPSLPFITFFHFIIPFPTKFFTLSELSTENKETLSTQVFLISCATKRRVV